MAAGVAGDVKVTRPPAAIVNLSAQEAYDLACCISEVLWALQQPQQDGQPFNWRSDPQILRQLHNLVKPESWGDL